MMGDNLGPSGRFFATRREEGIGDPRVQKLARPAQQCGVDGVLHQRVLEQKACLRRHAPSDNNTVTRQFGMVMNRYDVLLAPTCAVRVPPANGSYSLLAEEELDVWINRLV